MSSVNIGCIGSGTAYVHGPGFNSKEILAGVQAAAASMKVMEMAEPTIPTIPKEALRDFKASFLGNIPSRFKKQRRKIVVPVYTGAQHKVDKSNRKAKKKAKRRNR